MNVQIYEEASEWIMRHRSASLDLDARRRFDSWLRESPQHVRAYLEVSSIWEGVSELDPNHIASASELIARARVDSNVYPLIESRGDALEVPASGDSKQIRGRRCLQGEERTTFRLLVAMAASVLMTVGVASWLYLQRDVYRTDIGEQRTITLTDSSSVQLNARSRIRVRYTGQERAVDLLEGQALFRVAKDPDRPFIVESDGTQVRAVGTLFDVYKKSIGTVVTVVEGRVAVLPSAPEAHLGGSSELVSDTPERAGAGTLNTAGPESTSRVLLTAGEQLVVAQAARTRTVPRPANIEAATAWTHQRLVFDFSPLTEVAEEFNRYNSRPLVIDDPGLNDFHVSGSFSSTDPTLLLRFLRAQRGIAVSETATEIRISRQEAPTG